ncbi:MAG: ATP-binding cassette domain-containing protein [Nitrospirota bacterium]|nr:ATP-binding cassette domain-containing protein [Nitrospirota bacterium]
MKLGLRVSHVRKAYNGNEVLKDCSFSFEQPGTYVLTGANGSGKSTFLRICALLEAPDRGEIIYLNEKGTVPGNIALQRRITLVLPKIGLFNTTVFKNISYGLRIRGMKGKETADRVERVLEFVGLIHKKDQTARTLSSGEAQRAGIARALVIEPDILFLDEPTASIDRKNTEIIENIIHQLKQDNKSVIVMTTHDQTHALRLADFRMLLSNGKISAS